ncbi:MAG: serine--tRNA ligase [Candidatus Omnitrophica bacterium]|nr:serine--tRNA ligase [Candidatus Omnitrophota bacterium]MBU4478054.1 serine--tRNA ligase [Candidatus Omnitrophota bacterium]
MLDIKFIRENPDKIKTALKNRNLNLDIEQLLGIDRQWKALTLEVEELKRKRNIASDQMAVLVQKKEDISGQRIELKGLSQKIKELDEKVGDLKKKIHEILICIPNIPHKSVPIGKDASANILTKTWGEPIKLDFPAKTHIELSEFFDIIDFARATKLTGSNFVLYKGAGALLERALINFMLGMHTKKHGFVEVSPPFIVNRASMTGTGQLPKLEEDMYRTSEDDFFLIPTAEVPVTNIFRDEILGSEQLPIYYTAYTPCFRREAGSYGKDTRGLLRVHQFDKVELVKFVRPETSYAELESLLACAEAVLQALELPYRVLCLSTGDISFAAAKCYDIEVWAPGVEKWLEVSSCSNFEDFQARRANIRYKDALSGKVSYLHTLNGSGVALARTVIAIIENYQQKDGSILIPKALQPYMDGMERIG